MRLILKKNWFYSLYDNDGHFILKVAYCNGSVDFTRNFKFNANEISTSESEVDSLAKDIIDNYQLYKFREVFI